MSLTFVINVTQRRILTKKRRVLHCLECRYAGRRCWSYPVDLAEANRLLNRIAAGTERGLTVTCRICKPDWLAGVYMDAT